ncbi:MAG TPA: glycerate kinase [Clostridiales bacterium UBA8960]|jgi:glycerate kinase|nr:glycerate kinase [Clostridiales bacterium UBA8960]
MYVIIIPDSFKGTLSSTKVIDRIHAGLRRHFKDLEVTEIPIADGGEGTVHALVHALGGTEYTCDVQDPLGRPTVAKYGICGKKAIIEMAEAAGINKVRPEARNLAEASTYGVGEMLLKALNHDVDEVIVGIGGSATNDGGVGMLQALGARFYGESGQRLIGGGKILEHIRSVDTSMIDKRLFDIPIVVMCDVTNPLTGPLGATYVYGPQKGGDEETLNRLEMGMKNYRKVIMNHVNIDVDMIPGSGASGGLGAAFVSFLGATLKPGIDSILDLVNFDALVETADLVITGEGKMDEQTVYGKVPTGVSKRCVGKKAKVIAIVGTEGKDARATYDYGIDAIVSTVTQNMSEEELMQTAELRLDRAVDSMCRLLRIGAELK